MSGLSSLEFCKAALAQGHKLTLYVRSPAKLPAEISNHVDVSVVQGTLEDMSSFQLAAASGPTVFVSFAGPVMNSKGTVRQYLRKPTPSLVSHLHKNPIPFTDEVL